MLCLLGLMCGLVKRSVCARIVLYQMIAMLKTEVKSVNGVSDFNAFKHPEPFQYFAKNMNSFLRCLRA